MPPLIKSNEKVASELNLSEPTPSKWRTESISLPIVQTVVGKEENAAQKKSLPERIPAFGILMSALSVFCLFIVSVIVKVMTQLHSIELLAIRCSFQFLFYMIATLIYKYPFFGLSGHRFNLVLRGLYGTISSSCIYMAYRMLPLTDATTIYLSSPVFVTILAYFMLKEPLTFIQVFTGTVTIIGVVIIAKPEFIFSPNSEVISEQRLEGIALSITASFTTALVLITLRKLKTTPVAVVIMWYSLINTVSSVIFLIVLDQFIWPTGWYIWALLTVIGVCGICGQFFMTIALHYESAGPVSVVRVLNIVLSLVWDVLFLSEAYDWASIVGAGLVSASIIILGVFKWKHEKPELFENLKYKLCCCAKSDDNLFLKKYYQPFYDSIDSGFIPITDRRN